MERTIEIPQSRQLTLQVPDEVPVGPANIFLVFQPVTKTVQNIGQSRWQRLMALKGTGTQPDGLTGLEEQRKNNDEWPA
jgi:hypothetical protein